MKYFRYVIPEGPRRIARTPETERLYRLEEKAIALIMQASVEILPCVHQEISEDASYKVGVPEEIRNILESFDSSSSIAGVLGYLDMITRDAGLFPKAIVRDRFIEFVRHLVSELHMTFETPDFIGQKSTEGIKDLLRVIPHDDERRIYPEISRPKGWTELKRPTFPDQCPICGAAKAADNMGVILYQCGGSYLAKPQIQNHTDKWWGRCESDKINEGRLRKKELDQVSKEIEETSLVCHDCKCSLQNKTIVELPDG